MLKLDKIFNTDIESYIQYYKYEDLGLDDDIEDVQTEEEGEEEEKDEDNLEFSKEEVYK